MIHTLLNVLFVLIAITMIVFILLQRGAGAQAGSGFGAGASGTVFGARGSANFLTSATKWLAAAFFSLTLFMAWQASHEAKKPDSQAADLGIMSQLPVSTTPAASRPALPAAAPSAAPAAPIIAPAPASTAPVTPAPAGGNKGG
jgi:preprotein translocase subunit SecG